MTHTTLVIPCYNEARRLPVECLEAFLSQQDWVRLVLVNDGSRDETPAILETLHARRPDRVQVLHLPTNQGKAEAVRQGCLRAFEDSPQFIGYWDADLAAPLEALLRFREIFDREPHIQLVLGSRLVLLGHDVRRTFRRRCLGSLFAWAAACVLGLPIRDTQAGHKLFRATDRLREVLQRPFLSRWIFDVELLSRWIGGRDPHSLTHARRSIYELPLEQWRDVIDSKVRLTDMCRAFTELAQMAFSTHTLHAGAAFGKR